MLHFAVYCGWPKASNLEMYVRQAWTRGPAGAGRGPRRCRSSGRQSTSSARTTGRSAWTEAGQEFADVNLVNIGTRPDTPYQHVGILNFVFGHVWQRPGLADGIAAS